MDIGTRCTYGYCFETRLLVIYMYIILVIPTDNFVITDRSMYKELRSFDVSHSWTVFSCFDLASKHFNTLFVLCSLDL